MVPTVFSTRFTWGSGVASIHGTVCRIKTIVANRSRAFRVERRVLGDALLKKNAFKQSRSLAVDVHRLLLAIMAKPTSHPAC